MHVHIYAACPMSMQHVPLHPACPCLCSMSHYMLRVHVHTAYPCPCCMSMFTLYVHVCCLPIQVFINGTPQDPASTMLSSACIISCMSKFMSILHVQVHTACPYPSCILMSMLHVVVPGARPCACFMSTSMQHVNAACLNLCSTDLDMQHLIWTCSEDMSMQHGPGLAVCI